MEWPKVESKSSKSLTEYKFNDVTWLFKLMISVILIGVLLPYFIVLYRGTLHPFLPTISQAAGSPPQSGIYSISIALWAVLAFIGLNVLHMGIRIHMKRLNDDQVLYSASLLNKLLLILGHVSIMGVVLAGSYPVDSYRSSDEWVKVTLVPHGVGAACFFIGALLYSMAITYLLYLIHPEQKQILRIRIFLNCLTAILSVLLIMTTNDVYMSLVQNPNLRTCIVDPDSVQYNLRYLIHSVSEWCVFFIIIAFIITLKDEVKAICFTMTVTLGAECGDDETAKKKTLITDPQEEKTENNPKLLEN